MAITRIDLDDDVLDEAMRLMGAATKDEAVNTALREYVQRARRVAAATRLLERGQRGDFDAAEGARDTAKREHRRP
ncbi:type II toxin-antitoxin system VapB family antitoxin [Nocardia camponoti]|uniref:Type II toxin-antitoxin system VapB family antitoxin n=1 Tax=Nocardia camponoti TaxID=1616106 RepID=A0A917QU55_9NOCA|nr:type II toxin-antitoxin system VapB family antitoxin [Nocardia camponoti]GGK68914.1 hypothetical protein GCM10011591_46280 [Nocardia camponoti]